MISLAAFFRRMRARSPSKGKPTSDVDQLRRLHRRLVRALGEDEPKELVEILAEDAQLRLERKVYEGRNSVLFALGNWLGVTQIVAAPEDVRLLTADVGLVSADWVLSCPDRGNIAEQVSCLCVRREGTWCGVQLRQEAVPTA